MRVTTDVESIQKLDFSKQQQAHLNIMTYLNVEAQDDHQSDYFSQKLNYHESPTEKKVTPREPKVDRSYYIDIDKLGSDGEDGPMKGPIERSYERDSRWKPHLSWSFISWSLQQRMEEQAAKREMQWQKIADKLGPFLIVDEGCYVGQGILNNQNSEELANERVPFIAPTRKVDQKGLKYTGGKHGHNDNQCQTLIAKYHDQQKKAKRRCMTVSGILISLIMLLFTIVILMASGVLHRY